MYRISHNEQEPIIDADQVEAIEPVIHSIEPGCSHVDEISREPLPSGHTSRRWGVGTKLQDGRANLKRDPWES